MIEELDLSGTPCFAPDAKLTGLKKINFIFGPNGSGKTTLSNKMQTINLEEIETEIQEIAVFNRDYIKDSFRECQAPGHITLGKENSVLKDEIDQLTEQLKQHEKKLEETQTKIKEAQRERERLLNVTQSSIGPRRKQLAAIFKDYNSLYAKSSPIIPGNNPTLFTKLLQFKSTKNATSSTNYDTIEKILDILKHIPEADATEIVMPAIPDTNYTLSSIETILKTTITLNNDSTMSTFIDKHNLHDWIRRGLATVETDNLSSCPFCQQRLTDQLIDELKKVFDNRHEAHIQAITKAKDAIKTYITNCETLTTNLTTNPDYKSIEYNTPITIINKALSEIRHTQSKLEQKAIESNRILATELSEDPFQIIREQLTLITSQITDRNNAINAGKGKRTEAIRNARTALYEYLTCVEFRDILDTYLHTLATINATTPTEANINSIKQTIRHMRTEIDNKLSKITQVGEKMAFINQILAYIGFNSFSLTTPEQTPKLSNPEFPSGQYILVRHSKDGTDNPIDTSTLSEGERTLLTFLYFIAKYYKDGKGSSPTANLLSTLLVIDDPIASTDAETFFLITNIIRRLLDQVSSPNNNSSVKQVLITSHNTRFLKEIAFNFLNEKESDSKACYYFIQKDETGSSVLGPNTSSLITNEYNELWAEVRRCNKIVVKAHKDHVTPPAFPLLGNTMRRIIESYFLDIGGLGTITSLSKSTDSGTATLLAFCNSSSHSSIGSDIYDILRMNSFKLLSAFKRVFETLDGGQHIGHYRMMMRDRPGDTSQQNG
jgi:hypothetical protein